MNSEISSIAPLFSGFQSCKQTSLACGEYLQAAKTGRRGEFAPSLAQGPQAGIQGSGRFEIALRAEARSSVEENLGSCCLHSGLDRGAGDPGTLGSPVVHGAEGDRGASEDSTHNGLTNSDAGNLAAVFEHEISRNTIINYRAQWSRFTTWAFGKGVSPLPADPALVAAYLAERMENHGHRPATLRTAASAIGFMHRASGLEDPRVLVAS